MQRSAAQCKAAYSAMHKIDSGLVARRSFTRPAGSQLQAASLTRDADDDVGFDADHCEPPVCHASIVCNSNRDRCNSESVRDLLAAAARGSSSHGELDAAARRVAKLVLASSHA